MAVNLRKTFSSVSSLIRAFYLPRLGSSYNYSASSTGKAQESALKLEDGAGVGSGKYLKWHKGGGILHKSANVDPSAFIEIGAIVHSECVIGAGVHVGSGTVIGPAVTIGQSTKIAYNTALSNCSIGDSCVIHNGVCVGQDGFGFFVDEHGKVVKKPQVGVPKH